MPGLPDTCQQQVPRTGAEQHQIERRAPCCALVDQHAAGSRARAMEKPLRADGEIQGVAARTGEPAAARLS